MAQIDGKRIIAIGRYHVERVDSLHAWGMVADGNWRELAEALGWEPPIGDDLAWQYYDAIQHIAEKMTGE